MLIIGIGIWCFLRPNLSIISLSIYVSSFEGIHGYKPNKHLVFFPDVSLVCKSAESFPYRIQDLHVWSLCIFNQVMLNINFKLICIDDIMNLIWEIMLWYRLEPSGFLQELIKKCIYIVQNHSKWYNKLIQRFMLLIYHLILILTQDLIFRICILETTSYSKWSLKKAT